jgi:hypothetical protein
MRISFEKHFAEDNDFDPNIILPYKTLRYIKKLKMRESCETLTS